jgi:fluoroacetyl-CoA thioesterase
MLTVEADQAGRWTYGELVAIAPGLTGSAELEVSDSDTSSSFGSGDVPVLATPRLLALAEQATVAAVAPVLEPGTTTVGYRVQIDHVAPTAVGQKVRAEAILQKVDGRRLTFRVSVSDGHGLIGAGRITRVLVNREHFLEKAASTSD